MNMITVLLGATGLLLVVAVALSFGAMNKRTNSDEVAKLKAEIAALQAAEQQLTLPPVNNPLVSGAAPSLAPAPFTPDPTLVAQPNPDIASTAPAAADTNPNAVPELGEEEQIRKLEEELRALEKQNSELAVAKEDVERENGVLKGEQEIISKPRLETDKKSRARAATIKAALLQARIIQWAPEGFGVAEIRRPDLQVGTVLAIRRQSGIYGQVKVDKIYEEENQAIVNPIVGTFPEGEEQIDVQTGDDLIIPPL